MSRVTKEYGFNGLLGCVTQFKSKATGTMVGIYHSFQSGIGSEPGLPWASVCEKHHTLVLHPNLLDATRNRDPRKFCENCQAR